MDVEEGEEVRCDGGLPGLCDTGKGEGAGDEESRGGIRGRRGPVRVKRTTVVFGRAELITRCFVLVVMVDACWRAVKPRVWILEVTYRLRGSCVLRALALSRGLKDFTVSSDRGVDRVVDSRSLIAADGDLVDA